MSAFPPGFNIASKVFHFDSLPLAIASTIVSVLLLAAFAFYAVKASASAARTIYLYFVAWSTVRAIGFALRAACLVGDNTENLTLCIVAMVFNSIGFIPLLKALVMNAFACAKFLFPGFQSFKLAQRISDLLFLGFTGMLIAYLNMYLPNIPSPITPTEELLRDIAYWGLTALAVLPTLFAIFAVFKGVDPVKRPAQVLIVQGLLLTIKISFSLYKNYNNGPNDEIYFYLLTFLPELVYMGFYVVPTF
ncbi:hypothetical protein HDU98_009159, partial [Podochytrium sp. JEL0797]